MARNQSHPSHPNLESQDPPHRHGVTSIVHHHHLSQNLGCWHPQAFRAGGGP
ncbi:hypothetical protein JMJ77_0007423 [Colletotrichum scovillei]|uniref:Uncharacterized protein n=1 Tax=Colletotrichum scovillei TaxID=1209932 RepID=A0A9P7UFL2_9PEZI|nr:hypothetical protein JMJ77_0007423 [Colletotrichum scovillei]KAG7074397.1 hypothetical protein JMJ76_0010877 [Colletotrichum scovillei]KAG7081199.1 hypothetical protein JMJ78_0003326 [Colletotrichum scovillei]